MQRNKLVVVGALACVLSGFGIATAGSPASEVYGASRSLLYVEQEAEAALLPNPPAPVIEVQQPAEPTEPVKLYSEADVEMLARLIYTEARGVKSKTEQAAVVWCVLNRLDNPERLENSIAEVVCAPYQFDYRPWAPVTDEFAELAQDVLERWQLEKRGKVDVGRVLPAEYLYFEGWGGRNWFSAEWKSQEYWGWELASPYED